MESIGLAQHESVSIPKDVLDWEFDMYHTILSVPATLQLRYMLEPVRSSANTMEWRKCKRCSRPNSTRTRHITAYLPTASRTVSDKLRSGT